MFMGQYEHILDKKKRLFIPSRFRKGLRKFIITCGLEDCLFMYTPDGWEKISKKFSILPLTKSDARAFIRTFLAGANECDLDKQGRILIPQNLVQYSDIKEEIIIIGVLDRIELWSKKKWQLYNANAKKSYCEIAEKLVDLGI